MIPHPQPYAFFHEAGCFGIITDKYLSDIGKKGRSSTLEIISSQQQTSMNTNEDFKKFLFGISEEEPFEMPVAGRQMQNIGSFTVFRGEITHVNKIPVEELCRQMGLSVIDVRVAVDIINALHESQHQLMH